MARIDAHEPELHAFVEVYADDACRAAHGAVDAIGAGYSVGLSGPVELQPKDGSRHHGRRLCVTPKHFHAELPWPQ